jgi:hypothetical protein
MAEISMGYAGYLKRPRWHVSNNRSRTTNPDSRGDRRRLLENSLQFGYDLCNTLDVVAMLGKVTGRWYDKKRENGPISIILLGSAQE